MTYNDQGVRVTSEFNAIVRKHKAALTRAKNSGDHNRVLGACAKAFADFDVHGWPDCWANWERAQNDALLAIRYERV